MRRVRLLLIGLTAFAVLLVIAVAVVFSSAFQTWAVRRVLARQPNLHATVGSVSAGLYHVELHKVRLEQDGVVVDLPSVTVDLPLMSAAMGKKVFVSRLVAAGWMVDMSKSNSAGTGPTPTTAPMAATTNGTNSAAGVPRLASAGSNPGRAFAGVFGAFQLPVDVTLDGVQLAGDVLLPAPGGRAQIRLSGGGVGAGREGKFNFVAEASLPQSDVNALDVRGEITATMDTPRTFTRLAANLDAAAKGAQFPNGVMLAAKLAAARGPKGETYSFSATTQGRPLLTAEGNLPRDASKIAGTWRVDLRDSDVAPFTLGRPLPAFTAAGAGTFDTDVDFNGAHAAGRLDATADRLGVIRPELAGIGAVRMTADFDLARRGDTLTVQKLDADLVAAQPVAHVHALQPFEFNPRTAELKATDPARELLGVTLEALPVAWAQPFITRIALTGGDVRGACVATARSGGMLVRTTQPLTIPGLSMNQAGKPLLQNVDVALEGSGDYAPQGWQADIAKLTMASGGATIITAEAKTGRLTRGNAPLKATGRLTVDLAAALRQPIGAQTVALTHGAGSIEFAANITADTTQLEAKVAVQDLVAAATGQGTPPKLPAISADIRADLSADGRIALHAPLVLQQGDRKSDLAIHGTIAPVKNGHTIDAQVTSTNFVVDDAKLFTALIPASAKPAAATTTATPGKPVPPWSGLSGTLALQLQKVVYSDSFEVSNVTGQLHIDAGALRLDHLRAGMGEGSASLAGTVAFDAQQAQPYGLSADVTLQQFDPGPLFKALNPQQPPTVEGRFDITSKLAGRANSLGDLASAATGQFQVSSKGGVFRGLPVSVSNVTEKTGKVADFLASAGNAIGALTRRKEYADVANKAQAVGEVAKGLNPIPYDQLKVEVTRDAMLNAVLKDFMLISPEIRLTGSGQTIHQPGKPLLEDALTMEFKLRAQGHYADLLKYLGALEPQKDDLGYAACTLPLKVTGTLGKPDTGELSTRIAQLALEKTGVTDKAGELLNRLIGGK